MSEFYRCTTCGQWVHYGAQHVCPWTQLKPSPFQFGFVPTPYTPTQRDYFAARARQGMMSQTTWLQSEAAEIAKTAFAIADAMIAAGLAVLPDAKSDAEVKP